MGRLAPYLEREFLRSWTPTESSVPRTREVLDAPTANQHDGMFLQIVPDPRNVSRHFDSVGEADTRYLAQSGVWFLGCRGIHPRTYTPPLRTSL